MTTKTDFERELETKGTAMRGLMGGPAYNTYYTPSGKKVRGLPSIREGFRTDPDTGEKETYTRDATPEQRGWLVSMPQVLKLECTGCAKYHDTQDEVDVCIVAKAEVAKAMLAKAEVAKAMEGEGMLLFNQEQLVSDPNSGRIDILQGQVDSLIQGQDDMMALLKKALGVKE